MKTPQNIALIAVTRKGIEQASLLRQRLRSGDLYRPAHHGPVHHAWEHAYDGSLADQVRAWFANHEQLVFFLAAGAVTRLIAPWLVSKETDPGVLAIDEAGQFVMPLLSGHRGGANAFARTVAGCLGASPVVTTASDVLGGLSLDLLEESFGWTAEPRELLKDAAMALVNKEPVAILQEIGTRGAWLHEIELPENVALVTDPAHLASRSCRKVLWVTDRALPAESSNLQSAICNLQASVLWFRPKSLVLGVGCERGLSREGLEQGLDVFLREHGYAQASIDTLASVTVKADEPALLEIAARHGWQTVFYTAEELGVVPGIVNPSAVVQKCVGTPGVAEPAALLAANTSRLLVEKQVVRVPGWAQAMTFALARHARFEVKSSTAGKVHFVGAGPGDAQLLTLKAHQILRQAEVVIYAGSLIPEAVLRHVPGTAILHNSAYLTLEQVIDLTLAAARSGKSVVRLHSGDTSLYSAIQEQMAILEKENVDFDVVPGISSFQALAAALKSELTLPEKVQTIILTRGEGNTPMPEKESLASLAQHQATLCIFLSALLVDKVQEQLLSAYPPNTPVAIAHRISWPDEEIVVTRLDRLAEEMRQHDFRRTTLIVVGAAVGGRHQRSHLYDKSHGHLFRKRKVIDEGRGARDERQDPAPLVAPSPLTPHPSPLTPHPSPLTPHLSPLTPHASPLTPHLSRLTPGPSRKTILLLSGTSEGPLLATALNQAGFHVRATVTRQEACVNLFGDVHDVDVEARGFTDDSLAEFLLRKDADLVLDATHPFAVRITRIAHGVCTRLGVPYVRYERPDWPAPPGTRLVDSFAEAAALLPDLGRRIMLTIGAKQLKHFAHLHDRLTLFARILPSPLSLEQARKEGFTAEKVLCLRPPFSIEFNRALFREYKVEGLVTKASGCEGGVVEKVTAARELGMHVVMIRRPDMPDMAAVSDLDAAIALCRRHLES